MRSFAKKPKNFYPVLARLPLISFSADTQTAYCLLCAGLTEVKEPLGHLDGVFVGSCSEGSRCHAPLTGGGIGDVRVAGLTLTTFDDNPSSLFATALVQQAVTLGLFSREIIKRGYLSRLLNCEMYR